MSKDHTNNSRSEEGGGRLFKNVKVFNPDTLLEDMLSADEGTLFCLGEKSHKNHEGDDTVEITWARIYKTKDSPTKPTKQNPSSGESSEASK